MISILAKQLLSHASERFADTHLFNNDEESQLKRYIESALSKTNLVTRDEFDAQTAVLQRTRERVDTLEKQVKELEELVANTPTAPHE